jgi:hypothetical protein
LGKACAKVIAGQDAFSIQRAEEVFGQGRVLSVIAAATSSYNVPIRIITLRPRHYVFNYVVVLVKLSQAIEALPTFALENELPILGHAEQINLLEWHRRRCRRHRKEAWILGRQHNTKPYTRAFAVQDLDAPLRNHMISCIANRHLLEPRL